MDEPRVIVTDRPLDTAAIMDSVRAGGAGVGALASFVGLMRDVNEGQPVGEMVLEHYPGMTESAIARIVLEARERWDLVDAAVAHRHGRLRPGDPIVVVAVASAHRRDAFEACAFIMDFLKTRAPFWKRETRADGEHWVAARDGDARAAERWRR